MSFPACTEAFSEAVEALTSLRRRMICQALRRADGPMRRDEVMYLARFPSPREHPVIAYATFALEVMRINSRLRRIGMTIANDAAEMYWLRELPKN